MKDALLLDTPVEELVVFGDQAVLRTFLNRMRQEIAGGFQGSTFTCTRKIDQRVLRVRAERASWNGEYAVDVHVISSDLWRDDDGEVTFLGAYVFLATAGGLSRTNATNAATVIQERVTEVIDRLILAPEFSGKVSR